MQQLRQAFYVTSVMRTATCSTEFSAAYAQGLEGLSVNCKLDRTFYINKTENGHYL